VLKGCSTALDDAAPSARSRRNLPIAVVGFRSLESSKAKRIGRTRRDSTSPKNAGSAAMRTLIRSKSIVTTAAGVACCKSDGGEAGNMFVAACHKLQLNSWLRLNQQLLLSTSNGASYIEFLLRGNGSVKPYNTSDEISCVPHPCFQAIQCLFHIRVANCRSSSALTSA
jgi:hypothetical protein